MRSEIIPNAAVAAARTPVEALEPRRLVSASLLADLNRTPGGWESSIRVIGEVHGQLLFTANDGTYLGEGLYRTDGTEAGTARVMSFLEPPPASQPAGPVDFDSTVFFVGERNRSQIGPELWRSDGTAQGTVEVAYIQPGRENRFIRYVTRLDNYLLFFADDGIHGLELWRSDGTAAGTALVKDMVPGPASVVPDAAAAGAGLFFFITRSGSGQPSQLWRSDGTESGTIPLVALPTYGDDPDDLPTLACVNGVAFFSAAGEGGGRELWRSDGTPAGTALVREIRPGSAGSDPGQFCAVNGLVFFSADDGEHGVELWKTDGTELGTVLVKDAAPGPGSSIPRRITAVADKVFFFTQVDSSSIRWVLWASDGTDAGTNGTSFGGFVSPVANPWATDVLAVGPRLFFAGAGGLWVSDGTSGVARVGSFDYVDGLAAFGNGVAFGAMRPENGGALWKSDGTVGGTVMIKDVNEVTKPSLYSFWKRATPVAVNGRAVFAARSTDRDALWSTDGTASGTVRLTDEGFLIDGIASLDGTAYVLAKDGTTPEGALWRTDGTPSGTSRISALRYELVDPFLDGQTPLFTESGGALYFSADDPAGSLGFELYKTDGTEAGTVRVKDLLPGPGSSFLRDLTDLSGTLFFTTGGRDLWKSDGTEAGTVLVKSFPADGSAGGVEPGYLTAVDGLLMFRARAADGRAQLWKSDGTAAGTVLVRQFGAARSTSYSVNPRMVSVNGTLFFNASDDAPGGEELWKSDGTPEGTVLVKDIAPGPNGSWPGRLLAFNGKVYFSAVYGGWHIWSSDGTEGGTRQFLNFNWGSGAGGIQTAAVINGRLYFSSVRNFGNDVWVTNGTESGTRLVHEGAPERWDNPMFFTPVGERMVFWVNDVIHGYEPWAAPLEPPEPGSEPAEVVGRHLAEPSPAGAADADVRVVSGKTALVAGGFPSFANVTNASTGVRGVVVDIARAMVRELSKADFAFQAGGRAVDPQGITIIPGGGALGSDRVVVTFAGRSVVNSWLQVTVKATASTGLGRPDVFAFGSLVGETGDRARALGVTPLDLLAVRRAWLAGGRGTGGVADERFDFDRDGVVGPLDVALVRRSLGRILATLPSAAPRSAAMPPDPVPTSGSQLLRDEGAAVIIS